METGDKRTIYLVDGSNYLFRAYYAIRDLSNSKGFPTNAVFGFTNMLVKLLREYNPTYIAVAFDRKGPTFRHEAFMDYKAQRKPIPEALIPQIPIIKEIVRGLGIQTVEKEGFEADDLIGTLAVRWADEGGRVVIVTGDKDMLQLVTDRIVVIDTMKDKCYDVSAVRERFGVEPRQVAHILALTGDASDNIPGVPGIGPKNAERLIQEFGTVEHLLDSIDKVKNARAKVNLRQYADQARMSLELVRIRTDVDVPVDLEELARRDKDLAVLFPIFRELEFSTFLQEMRIEDEEGEPGQVVTDMVSLNLWEERLRGTSFVALEPVYEAVEPIWSRILGTGLAVRLGGTLYLPLAQTDVDGWSLLRDLLGREDVQKGVHDLKRLLVALMSAGVALRGKAFDTMIAAYLLNPARKGFDLTGLSLDYLRRSLPDNAVAARGMENANDREGNGVRRRAAAVLELSCILREELEKNGLLGLFEEVEMRLAGVLARMEYRGVLVDREMLRAMSKELQGLLDLSMEKIYRLAGERFNINSPKQLQTILFDKLKMPRGRKIKEGYSTDVEVLTNLAATYELPAEILHYRSLAKLKTTYVDALPGMIHSKTGRIHTTYNQTATVTGRLSSSNPNLQNIPVRTLEGKRIRQAFVAPEDWGILSADYSQIELRILAHLSGDEILIDAFRRGEDVHVRTASTLFGTFPEMVNDTMRRQAKVINFGVIYGMSAFGLAKELGVPQKLAQTYIDGYFRKHAGISRFIDETLDRARKLGYVQTLLGRRRYLPEINADNAAVRQFAERMAINTPIQGTAADLIKMAMIRIDERLRQQGMAATMIMQVHDELVFEAPREEKERLMAIVKEEMEGVMELKVPLTVEMGFGSNWDEAHR